MSKPMNIRSSLRLDSVVVTVGAGIATGSAYLAMVSVGTDNFGMSTNTAYALMGVFEVMLVGFALMARRAAQEDRPALGLLAFTWLFSLTSGSFAGIHELELGHGADAAVLRIFFALLAALGWHYLLVGDRHAATGTSWSELMAQRATARAEKKIARIEKRKHRRMEAAMNAAQAVVRAQADAVTSPSARNRKAVKRAIQTRLKTERAVRQVLTPAEVDGQVEAWVNVVRAQAGGVRAVSQIETVDVAASASVALELEQISKDEHALAEVAASNFARSLRNVHADTAGGRAAVHGIHAVQTVHEPVHDDQPTDVQGVHDGQHNDAPTSMTTSWTTSPASTLSTLSMLSTDTSTLDTVDNGPVDAVHGPVHAGVQAGFQGVHESNPLEPTAPAAAGQPRQTADSTLSTLDSTVSKETLAPTSGDVIDNGPLPESAPDAVQAVHDRPSLDSTESTDSTPDSRLDTSTLSTPSKVSTPDSTPSKVSTPDSTVSTETPDAEPAQGRRRLVNGRLAPDLESEIRRRDAAGEPPAEIAKALGVSRSTVYNKLKASTPARGSVVPMQLRERA